MVIDIPDRIHYGIEKGITVNGSEASQILIDAVKKGTPLSKGKEVFMTNQEWLSHISPEEWVRAIHWLYHDYGTRFADSESAIIQWLRQDIREEQNNE